MLAADTALWPCPHLCVAVADSILAWDVFQVRNKNAERMHIPLQRHGVPAVRGRCRYQLHAIVRGIRGLLLRCRAAEMVLQKTIWCACRCGVRGGVD